MRLDSILVDAGSVCKGAERINKYIKVMNISPVQWESCVVIMGIGVADQSAALIQLAHSHPHSFFNPSNH